MIGIWKFVPKYPDYMISDQGEVLSLRNQKFLHTFDNHGYRRVKLNGVTISLHRLVLLAFRGEPPPSSHANHKNFDRSDNHLTNLEWVTPKQNIAHAVKNGHRDYLKGIRNHKAKLTEEQVREIRSLGWTPENNPHKALSSTKIAKIYGVSHPMILAILRGHNWCHL